MPSIIYKHGHLLVTVIGFPYMECIQGHRHGTANEIQCCFKLGNLGQPIKSFHSNCSGSLCSLG